jgi:hypothetical protein
MGIIAAVIPDLPENRVVGAAVEKRRLQAPLRIKAGNCLPYGDTSLLPQIVRFRVLPGILRNNALHHFTMSFQCLRKVHRSPLFPVNPALFQFCAIVGNDLAAHFTVKHAYVRLLGRQIIAVSHPEIYVAFGHDAMAYHQFLKAVRFYAQPAKRTVGKDACQPAPYAYIGITLGIIAANQQLYL